MMVSPAQLLSMASISSWVISIQKLSFQRSSNQSARASRSLLFSISESNSPCLLNPEYVRLLLPRIAALSLRESGLNARYNLACKGYFVNNFTHTLLFLSWVESLRRVCSSRLVGLPSKSCFLKSRAISSLYC